MKQDKRLPNSRDTRQVPLIGGVVIFIVWTTSFLTSFFVIGPEFPFGAHQVQGLILGASVVFLMGLMDDLRDLDYRIRFILQFGSALLLVSHGLVMDEITVPFMGTVAVGWLGTLIFVFWIVVITNAINLIDGLDGLAVGVSIISLFFISLLTVATHVFMSYVVVLLALILMMFIKYARYPAKTFLGNSGSFLLGFLLAVFSFKASVKGTTLLSLFVPLMIMAVPLFDLIRLFMTRSLKGKNPFRSDAGHLHYMLLNLGLNHLTVVRFICLLSFALGLLGFLVTLLSAEATLMVFFVILISFYFLFKSIFYFRGKT